MPAKTPTPKSTNETLERRTEQLELVDKIIKELDFALVELRGKKKHQLNLLESVSKGLYEEIDKLSKKAPAEPVTDLALAQINDVIRETKELVEDDSYVQRLNEFVAAGDNPQHRDAVMVLRAVRQGLERYRSGMEVIDGNLARKLAEAKYIYEPIRLYLKGQRSIDISDLEGGTYYFWATKKFPKQFDFSRLDEVDLRDYFLSR